MKPIPFTQCMRPNGRPMDVSIERPDEVVARANDLIAKGYRFEAEVLMNGIVSLTVSDGEQDIACELVDNGTDVPNAVDRLVEAAPKVAS